VIVLSSDFFFWSLYYLLSFCFGHCKKQRTKEKDRRQYKEQKKKTEVRRQYNDQKKKTEDNTMTKRKRQRTIQ
jgi:hypothetical protein